MTAPDRGSAAHWNERYAGESLLFGEAPNAWLQEHEALLPRGGHVLCVADGDGRNSVWLAQRGHRVEAFDFAEVAVQKARRFAAARGVQVDHHVAAVEQWAWREGTHDAVVAIFIQFLPPPTRRRRGCGCRSPASATPSAGGGDRRGTSTRWRGWPARSMPTPIACRSTTTR